MNKKYNNGKNWKTMIAVAALAAAFSVSSAVPAFAASKYVEVTGNLVNVRNGAGKSAEVLERVRKGEQYAYLSEETDASGIRWYKIQLSDKQQGWIMAEYSKTTQKTAETTQKAAEKQVEITGKTVNVRSGAGKSYSKIGTTAKGKKYKYLDSKKDSNGKVWYKIQYTSSKTGWVIGSLSKLTDTAAATTATTAKNTASAKQVEITGKTVAVRSDAGTSATKIGSTAKGKKYPYLDSKKDSGGQIWYKIQYTSSKTGWVIGSLSKLTDTAAATTATTAKNTASAKQVEITGKTVNVRSGAGTSASKIGSTAKGKKYQYLDSKKDANGKVWYKIQYTSSKTGWVIGSLSKLTNTAAATTATTAKNTASSKQVEITGNPVAVRADAGKSYAKIGSTSKGKKYQYLDSKKDSGGQVWYKIQYTSDKTGWVIGSLSKLNKA